MAKVTLSTITTGYGSVDALNTNFTAIQTAIEKTLSRDGTSPNAMSASLDMNSNRVLNVATPSASADGANKAYVDAVGATLGGSAAFATQLSNTADTNLGDALVGVKKNAIGAVGRTLHEWTDSRRVSILDFGGGIAKTAAENAAAINAAQAHIRERAPFGGVVYAPAGDYEVAGSVVYVQENMTLEGEATTHYDDNYKIAGTRFIISGGDWGVCVITRQAALRNIRIIRKAGATTKYGLIASGGVHDIDTVTADGFEYGMVAGGGMNMNNFRKITCINNTKIGFTVLPQNAGGVGAECFPLISALIPGTASTIFKVTDYTFRANKVGLAILDGLNARFENGVCESNSHTGIVIYKRTNTDNIVFENLHQENDYTTAIAGSTLADIEMFYKDGQLLLGTVTGAWQEIYDAGVGTWIGGAAETTPPDVSSYSNDGGPYGVKFSNCWLGPNRYGCRVRSGRVEFDNCHMQSQQGNTFLYQITDRTQIHIKNPKSYGMDVDLQNMTVAGGLKTLYTYDYLRRGGATAGVASAAWTPIISNVTAMSLNNRYEYSISIANLFGTYGAQGYVFYDGNTVHLVPYVTGGAFAALAGGACAVRLNGNALEYQQNSGGAATVSFQVNCAGRANYN